MKTRYRIFTLVLALGMFLLVACGGGSGNQPTTEPQPSRSQPVESQPAESETPAPAPSGSQEPTSEPEPEVKQDLAEYLWEIPEDATLEEKIKLELRNASLISAMEPIFEVDSYKAYTKAATSLRSRKTEEKLAATQEAKANLVQKLSVEDGVIFLWNDFGSMPIADGESYTEEQLDAASLLGYGYTTIVVKYLVDDPAAAKGNIIACSGGGMKGRSNGSEGYPGAEVFNELGYNYFLVQRRVEPYSDLDIFMDYQRAIRCVKYYAEVEGWGGQDMFAGVGWSGGAGTELGAIYYCYGDITPAEYDSDYVPDEIDAIDSDLDVAMLIYGFGTESRTEINPNNTSLPACYISAGSADGDNPKYSKVFYDKLVDMGIPTQLTIVEGAPHGYGVGTTNDEYPEGCRTWVYEADAFMQANRGYQASRPIEFPEAPEEYVMAKAFHGFYAFVQESDVIFALNEAGDKFYVKFTDFIGEHLLWGVIEDGVCTVDATLIGLYGEDVQWMYEDAMELETPWVSIVRD